MHPEWPLILFTFFLCVVRRHVLGVQGLLCVLGKGKKMQLAVACRCRWRRWRWAASRCSCTCSTGSASSTASGTSRPASRWSSSAASCSSVVLVLYFLLMRRSEDGMAPKWCGVLAIVAGLGLPAVTGDSYLMEALPSWDTPLLIAYYVVNAVFMGGLAATDRGRAVSGADDASGALRRRRRLRAACCSWRWCWRTRWSSTGRRACTRPRSSTTSTRRCPTWPWSTARASWAASWRARRPWLFWLGAIAVGVVGAGGAGVAGAAAEGGGHEACGLCGRGAGVLHCGGHLLEGHPVRGGHQRVRPVLAGRRARVRGVLVGASGRGPHAGAACGCGLRSAACGRCSRLAARACGLRPAVRGSLENA